jgi:hypothetical protein
MTAKAYAATYRQQSLSPHSQTDQYAMNLYHRATQRNWVGEIRALLTKQSPRRLLSLAEVADKTQGSRYVGQRPVALSQIRGSSSNGRVQDFDAHFRPLNEHSKQRWLNIARARQRGSSLPPVSLVQVGDIYYVQDGHHRISVARALGDEHITADVAIRS